MSRCVIGCWHFKLANMCCHWVSSLVSNCVIRCVIGCCHWVWAFRTGKLGCCRWVLSLGVSLSVSLIIRCVIIRCFIGCCHFFIAILTPVWNSCLDCHFKLTNRCKRSSPLVTFVTHKDNSHMHTTALCSNLHHDAHVFRHTTKHMN